MYLSVFPSSTVSNLAFISSGFYKEHMISSPMFLPNKDNVSKTSDQIK